MGEKVPEAFIMGIKYVKQIDKQTPTNQPRIWEPNRKQAATWKQWLTYYCVKMGRVCRVPCLNLEGLYESSGIFPLMKSALENVTIFNLIWSCGDF